MFAEYLDTHDLSALLAPREQRIPLACSLDRAAWQCLPTNVLSQIDDAFSQQISKAYPLLAASQFLAFIRSDDRQIYEDPYFMRRQMLLIALLKSCTKPSPAALDQVIDGLWLICEETFWGISAHNGSSHPGMRPAKERPLPDVDNPYIDLFAAQTASLLCWVCHLLARELDTVSPLLRRRVHREVESRILKPFFYHDDFWWMGMIRKNMNNWTPWILSNIMGVLLLTPMEDSRVTDGFARSMRMLDSYLAVMPPDGGCDEGVSYWNMAGGALLDCLEHISTLTEGKASFFEDEKIRNIGAFPLHAHITGDRFLNFADCDAKPPMDGERVYRYGRYTANTALETLGYELLSASNDVLSKDTPEIYRVLCRLFLPVDAPANLPCVTPQDRHVLPDLQLTTLRHGEWFVAMKAGHNADNHNHNDVGSFMLYHGLNPQLIDVGNMIYTAKTFNDERYTLWNTRSQNHNVPLIGDIEQAAGSAYAAKEVCFLDNGMQMDIAHAYPAEACVSALKRTMTLDGEHFTLYDEVVLTQAMPITWVFMLRHEPTITPGAVNTGAIRIHFDLALCAHATQIDVTDVRMAKNFPGRIWRLTLTHEACLKTTQTFSITGRK